MRVAVASMALLLCACAAAKGNSIGVEDLFGQEGDYSVLLHSSYCDQCAALLKDVKIPTEGFYMVDIDEFAVYDYFAYSSNAEKAKSESLGATSVSEISFAYAPLLLRIEGGTVSGYFCGYAECKEYIERGSYHAS